MAASKLCNVLVCGGGVMGLSTAYHLTKYMDPTQIVVVEKDSTYQRSASTLSWASVRQQFSLRENILLSQRSIEFLKDIDKHLSVEGEDPVDIQFKHGSYLFLTTNKTSHLLAENIAVQEQAGVKVQKYNAASLQRKYPYLNVEDVELASDCDADEGWFDPWALVQAFRKKVKSLGVNVIEGQVTQFKEGKTAQVRNGNTLTDIHYGQCVNATGISAGYTNELLNQSLPSEQRFTLPVIPQRRQCFNIACKEGPANVPLMCCPLGTVIRSEGPNYIVLFSGGTLATSEQEIEDFGDVDDSYFIDTIWENLAYRIPAFESAKILGGWVGYYEYNTLDQNALIGPHPLTNDHYNINGFSGHGIQHAPYAGRCLAEIMCGVEPVINIERLGLDRVLENKPYRERNIL